MNPHACHLVVPCMLPYVPAPFYCVFPEDGTTTLTLSKKIQNLPVELTLSTIAGVAGGMVLRDYLNNDIKAWVPFAPEEKKPTASVKVSPSWIVSCFASRPFLPKNPGSALQDSIGHDGVARGCPHMAIRAALITCFLVSAKAEGAVGCLGCFRTGEGRLRFLGCQDEGCLACGCQGYRRLQVHQVHRASSLHQGAQVCRSCTCMA